MQPGFGAVKPPWNYAVFGVLTVIVAILSFGVIDTQSTSDWLPLVMVLAGFAAGAILWPV